MVAFATLWVLLSLPLAGSALDPSMVSPFPVPAEVEPSSSTARGHHLVEVGCKGGQLCPLNMVPRTPKARDYTMVSASHLEHKLHNSAWPCS